MIEYYKNFSLEPLFYVNENGLVCQEEWKDIPDYEAHYQCSNLGRIKSLSRYVKHPKKGISRIKERILKQSTYGREYLSCGLSINGKPKTKEVHVLMGITFLNHKIGNRKIVVDHIKNKEKTNNCVWNLQIITQRKNSEKDKSPKSLLYGVFQNKYSTFTSQITFEGKTIFLGVFKNKFEAKELHNKAIFLINNGCSLNELLSIRQIKTATKGSFSPRITRNGKFQVRIIKNKIKYHIGTFDTLEKAKIAYDKSLIDIENNCFKARLIL